LEEHLGVSPLFLATAICKSWVLKGGNYTWVKDVSGGGAEEKVVGKNHFRIFPTFKLRYSPLMI
jgi:hypothetical protein